MSLVLSEGASKDGEDRYQPMEEDSADAELLPGYQWLLQDLPKLPLFDTVRGMTSTALQQVSVCDILHFGNNKVQLGKILICENTSREQHI